MTSGIHMIVLVGWMIALLFFYHKIFTVYYFDLGHGLLKELGVSFILGLIMTALTFYFWWLTAIIIIVVGLAFKAKSSSNAPFIIAVVLAVIVAFLGISMRRENGNDGKNNAQAGMSTSRAVVESPVEEGSDVEEETEQLNIDETEREIKLAEAREDIEGTSTNLKYADIGDSGSFVREDAEGNIVVTVTDIGMEYASENNAGYYILYVDTEIENNMNESITLGAMKDVSVYLDDYQYNDGDPQQYIQMYLSGFNDDWYEINAGRKGKATFYTAVTEADANTAGNIELEIIDSNLTILYRNNGQWLYGNQPVTTTFVGESSRIVYGDYSCSPNSEGGENIAYVMFTTDEDGGDFIAIDYYKDPDSSPSDTFTSSTIERGICILPL